MEAGEDEGDGFLTERLDQLLSRTYAGRIYVVSASASNTSQRTGAGAPAMAS